MDAPSAAGAAHDQGGWAPAGMELVRATVYALGVHVVPGPLADGALAAAWSLGLGPHPAAGLCSGCSLLHTTTGPLAIPRVDAIRSD